MTVSTVVHQVRPSEEPSTVIVSRDPNPSAPITTSPTGEEESQHVDMFDTGVLDDVGNPSDAA